MGLRWKLCATGTALAALVSVQAPAATSVTTLESDAVEPTGRSVFPLDTDLDSLGGARGGPLTETLVDSLPDGELYFKLRALDFSNGELRGQLQPLDGAIDAGKGTAIPLPPALLLGLLGLGGAGWAGRRRRTRSALGRRAAPLSL